MEAKQTPLIELLERVPQDARVVVEHDQFSSSSHPVGRLCHEAAAALRAVPGGAGPECVGVRKEMRMTPYLAIGHEELGEPTEAIDCPHCGQNHAIEYGTIQTLLPDDTWSEPAPSKLLGYYKCRGKLYLGTVEGRKWR